MNAMITSDVPIERFSGMCRTPAMTGTSTTPPPMASNPEAKPAPVPVRMIAGRDGLTRCPHEDLRRWSRDDRAANAEGPPHHARHEAGEDSEDGPDQR